MTATQTATPAATPATGWDSELFVLAAADRAALADRARSLAAFVESHPDTALPDLAGTLAVDLAPGGSRLAVVSGSAADLAARLRRAADRLADPKVKQVRDANGVYFFAEPLAEQGTVALLFPGEGAQYPDMLADLCGVFPEVEETFAWCDQLAAEAGRPDDSLRRVLHLPPDATPDQKAAAEAELRKLGPSIFGVLLADLAVIKVLWNLQLPVAAVAGHSAGEIAALLAAGAMRSEEMLGSRLVETLDLMQRQEDAAGGPEVVLLAVGAGKAAVDETAAAVAGGAVLVAMDNCPHQCVAVGPAEAVARVEAVLNDRGVLSERLPFRRPYHTPLFEPWMGPFRELFAPVPFADPHTPVYSCSTGEPFPPDPDAARDLFVNHWVHPVAFTRLVERMYADGVRVFVEAGPRGNLSAFVEDILRGRPFAAIPANVPRRSGPTQINHLVGQLVAHHVPINLGHLYAHRETYRVEWEPTPSPPAAAGGLASAPDVMGDYLAAMEQFLDVQREVMGAFLAGAGPAQAGMPVQAPYCLVGEVIEHEPGSYITFRRVMDEREDRYADDHTLGGRGVSRTDPAQNGLPVLPMTFSLEAMAEAASLLAPGKVVTAIRNIRLSRWLPFDPEPTKLEVRAAVAAVDPATGEVQVKADVRDLGNSFHRDAAGKVACEAVVVLADQYPDPPAPLPFELTGERPCRSAVEDLRRNMFHGPLFQMIRSLGRCGAEGIEGTLEVQPRDGWFASNPDPTVVIDPVLVDAAMHILGAWHLEQPDWTGRILLPIGVHAVEFFGPVPPVGSHLLLRGHNEEETARQVRHGVELFGPDGRVWLRLTGAGYWRFYLPFGDVNFFGPKDQYFLTTRLPAAEPPGRPDARCYWISPPADLQQPVLRASGVRVTMTARETTEYNALAGTDADRSDWFFGRLAAKDAVRAAWHARHDVATFPADMEAEVDPDGGYTIRPRGDAEADPFPPVAVAVAGGKVAAFSAFAERVGIALELLPKKADAAAERAAREAAARRAVADALRIDPTDCTVAAVDPATGSAAVAVTPGASDPYPNGSRVRAQTARTGDVVVATTTCVPA
ncbi:MAG: polyketide synthase dehydratase domain-containing protein [Gemmataceae bacterium]|nr:polyketide synthase dehydratase domain-containing protein [Gemmataceae bacterium]